MNTLQVQKHRLIKELKEAEMQLFQLRKEPTPNIKLLNHYADVVARNTELIRMIDTHLQESPTHNQVVGKHV